ncbi:MAG: hypothetical protein D6737_00300 [Chloroflexi bacterium]|nr:MAG: hypothetical protein D6737_00300 [Chloroflexota bacterium]
MSWVVFALLAPLILTVVNFSDKLIVERMVHKPRVVVLYAGVTGLFWGIVVWLAQGMPLLELDRTILIAIQGGSIAIAAMLYFTALSREHASNVIMLLQTAPIFVLLISVILPDSLVDQTISGQQFIGFILILSAVILVSFVRSEETSGGFRLSSAFWLILGANIIIASSITLSDINLENAALFDVLAYESMGFGAGALFFYIVMAEFRHDVNESIRIIPRRYLAYIMISESVFTFAKLVGLRAIDLGGPPPLVSVLNSTQVFFGILLGMVLTLALPGVYRENIQQRALLQKSALAAVLIVGVGLVAQLTVEDFQLLF